MDNLVLTRDYLESLTMQELLSIADRSNIDIPADLDWHFMIEMLLDLESDVQDDDKPLVETTVSGAAVPLPLQYNITFIDILVRDPLWVFVFWEIKTQDKEFYESAPDFSGYCLRVAPVAGRTSSREDAFTVAIESFDTAWYVSMPVSGGSFRVELCVVREERKEKLATSRVFTLPKLFEPYAIKETADKNPLLRLSGVDDFQVLRSMERRFL